MRLFAYYAFHSFINTVKKIFKTWIAIFFVIILFAALVGYIAGSVATKVSENTEIEETIDNSSESEEADGGAITEKLGISVNQFVELISAAVILLMLFLGLFSSAKADNMFQPADVIMLFASPMKPQSVMLFRLMSALGMQIIISFYMLAQIPNLMNAGIGLFGTLTIIFCWSLVNIVSSVLQVSIYTVMSKLDFSKEKFKKILGCIIGVIALAFIVFCKTNGGSFVENAAKFFAGENTRWIPYFGWLRGWIMAAVEGNLGMWWLFLGLTVGSLVLLIFLIWQMNPDYYEEAIASCEKRGEILDAARNNRGANVSREKERSEKLLRDGFNKGWGANVFFYKTMYNRKRFAILKFFSKTMITYLLVGGITAYFFKEVGFYAVALLTFYRTLGNPIYEDTATDFFVMIPESPLKKLLCSLAGSSVSSLIDMIPALIAVGILAKTPPILVLMYLLFALSIDFFGSAVGAFIAISVPVAAGGNIKQVVQIMFIYFGVLPAAGFIVAGYLVGNMALFVFLGSLFDFACSALFIALTPHFLINGNK